MAVSAYRMSVRITDGMSLSILENLQVSLNDRRLSISIEKFCDLGGVLAPLRRLKADMTNVEKPYPVLVVANIPKSFIDESRSEQEFQFISSSVISPSRSARTICENYRYFSKK